MKKTLANSRFRTNDLEQNYSYGDMKHFKSLMKFPSVVGNTTENEKDLSGIRMFQYTENDERQFCKLMSLDSGWRQSRISNRHIRHKQTRPADYTESDTHHFNELLALQQNYIIDNQQVETASIPSAVGYTQNDLTVFDKLMPTEKEEPGQSVSDKEKKQATDNTDVGYIKIIDYDKDPSRGKENIRWLNPGVKVRYFD